MSDINKKKLFIPRKLSGENSRWSDWNNSQPIKDGVRINQYDMEGKKQGYWEENWENTDKLNSKGNYIDDVKEGLWVFYHSDGSIWYEEEFKNGDQSKMIIYYYERNELESKQLYVKGKYVKDIPLTESKKLFIPRKLSDNDSRYSDWNNSQKIMDGKRINQYDSEGRKQGLWYNYNNEGNISSKGSYKNGLMDGYWEFYWENGKISSKGSFINGDRDGMWESYWFSGKLSVKGRYKNGSYNGIWEKYSNTGELEGKYLYEDGKLIKKIPLTESKKLFIPRKLSGENSRWSDWNNSQPIKDGVRINQYDNEGRKQGYWEFYYSSGNIHSKGNYTNGKNDGVWEFYWNNGNLPLSKELYSDGKLIKALPLTESKTPSFLLKEEMGLIREGNVQDYINNVISKIKNLPYETKKKYLTIAISTLLGYTSYPTIQTIFNNLPDKEVKEIVHKIMKKKDKKSIFNDGTKLRLSEKGFRHIMDEEQPKLVAYSLGDGKITIGYGHAEPVETTKLKVGDKITKEQAKIYLKQDLKIAADGVRRMFRDWKKQNKNYKVTQDMFDALVSMAFNIGVSGLRNTTFVDYLRDGNYKTAGKLIKQTKINNDTFPGLEKRRNRESDMFLSYLSKNNKINV
jgi:antitoxin component YwqK of YwqJK toxin-antitoxin module